MSLEFKHQHISEVKAMLEAGASDLAIDTISRVTNEILRATEYKFEQLLKEALHRKGVDVERPDFPEFLRGRLHACKIEHKTVYLLDGNAILERYDETHTEFTGFTVTASINYRFL